MQLLIRYATKIEDNGIIKEGDENLICTLEQTSLGRGQLAVYKTNALYYYSGNDTAERWTVRNGSSGGEIKTGDHVTFENKRYPGQYLILYGSYVTTKEMGAKPTGCIIDL